MAYAISENTNPRIHQVAADMLKEIEENLGKGEFQRIINELNQ
jgi:hypothetical protein